MQINKVIDDLYSIRVIDREELLNECIEYRLNKSVKSYEDRINSSVQYFEYRQELKTMRRLNRGG